MKTYKKNTDKETESGKSGIAAEAVPLLPAESDTNKSSSDPNMYGTTATEGGRAGCSSSIMSPIAEELADQSAALLDLQVSVNSINYEDVQTLTTHHIISGHNKQECKMMAGSRENVMEAAAQDHYQSPVVGPEPSVDHTSPHVYENCDFQEDAVYQNVVVDRTGRLVPITSGTVKATNTENDDVYSQVRFLRKSVQEINALVEKEKQRHFVTEKTLVMNRPTTVSHQDLVHMKRSHQFKDILSKFNSASDSGVATPKSAPKS